MSSQTRRSRIPQVALLLETSTEYGRGLLRGILRYVRLHGPWSLHVAPGHLEQVLPRAESWDGTGIIGRIGSPEIERLIRSTGLPFVASSLSESSSFSPGDGFGEIRTDSEAIARMAATHMLDAGFRNFAFCGFANWHWSTQRERTFVQYLEGKGLACPTHRIAVANWMQKPNWLESWHSEQPIIVKWLQSLPRPVALMACNDACGREVLQACAVAGLRVPDEVAVVGVDNDELLCELSSPPLSSVVLDLEKAGYEAALLLDHLMSGREQEGRVISVGPTRIETRRSSDVIVQEDPVVGRALQFIRDHSRANLGVINVAEEVRVSRRTLERRFYRALRRTVLSEITRYHLERAKQLLLETDLPCHQVAVEAGFGSLKTFNRTFGRKEATTPQNFRLAKKARASLSAQDFPVLVKGARAQRLQGPRTLSN